MVLAPAFANQIHERTQCSPSSESLQPFPFKHKNPKLTHSQEAVDSHGSRTSEMDSPSDILDKSHEMSLWRLRLLGHWEPQWVLLPDCIIDTGKPLKTPFLWASFTLSRGCRITGKRKDYRFTSPCHA